MLKLLCSRYTLIVIIHLSHFHFHLSQFHFYCHSLFSNYSKVYVQIDGLVISASPAVFLAEIFVMKLEKKALSTFANPPDFWYRYVDDTYLYILEVLLNIKKVLDISQQPLLDNTNFEHFCFSGQV